MPPTMNVSRALLLLNEARTVLGLPRLTELPRIERYSADDEGYHIKLAPDEAGLAFAVAVWGDAVTGCSAALVTFSDSLKANHIRQRWNTSKQVSPCAVRMPEAVRMLFRAVSGDEIPEVNADQGELNFRTARSGYVW